MTTVTYPFDPTGTNPLNRVVNEQFVLTGANDERRYRFIIPSAAPFFTDNVQMSFRNPDNSVRVLVEGVDYYFTHNFISASRACAKPIGGSIQFLDRTIQGVLRMSYNTLGGIWTLSDAEIAEILANNIRNPRTTSWEMITDIPVMFPVIDHEWNLTDMVGASELVEMLDEIRQAISESTGGGLAAHVANKSNPHEVTKAQVGLDNVQNFPVSTTAQAQAGTNTTSYMTPARTADAITAQVGNVVGAHANRTDNPHQVTAAQVGLGSVQNYGVADNAAAVAGVSTTLYMTPAGTRAVSDIINAALAAHEADQLNPHNVTKDQLMLFNVQNYAIATAQEAQAGDSNLAYMTPLRVKQAIAALASVDLQAHLQDTSNPHNVTAGQVGLGAVQNFGIASAGEAQAGVAANKYMTPANTALAINAQVGDAFIDHLNAINPHNTTKGDVGLGLVQNFAIATSQEAIDGVATDKYMTPQLVALTAGPVSEAAINAVLQPHLDDHNNPHQVTAAQVGAYTTTETDALLDDKLDATGTAADSTRLGGQDVNAFVSNVTGAVLDQVGTKTVEAKYFQSLANDPALGANVWLRLGYLGPVVNGINGALAPNEVAGAINDLNWFISGGEALAAKHGMSYSLQASIRDTDATPDPVFAELKQLTDAVLPGVSIGWTYQTLDLVPRLSFFMKMPNGSNPVSVLNLNKGGADIELTFVGDTEPVGITYLVANNPAAQVAALSQQVSDLTDAVIAGLNGVTTAVSGL